MKKAAIIFAVLISFPFFSQHPNSLVARYSFDNFNNEKNSWNKMPGMHGTSPVNDRFGNENSACQIHGNYGSYINLGTSDNLKPKHGSVSIWVKIQHVMQKGSGVESNPIIYTRSHSGEDFNEAYYVGYEINTKNIGVCVSASKMHQVSAYTAKELPLNKWHHIVITYDNDYFCLYVDGALEAKMVKNFETPFLHGDSIIVGNRLNEKNTRFLNAHIDDIEIHNKALTSAEVLDLFNAPNPNKTTILLRWILLIIAAVGIILSIIWLIKIRITGALKREREKNELLNRLHEQDTKVLKAQMNPHFIFNSLNSIQQFILSKENDKAEIYLSRFAKLMRKLLETNTHESISLNEELDLLRMYLEIESLRFNSVFSYEITLPEQVNSSEIYIPHFLIQPLVENAIWHGLLPKQTEKNVSVRFEKKDDKTLKCIVEDNGVGRKLKADTQHGKRSFALDFIRQRLDLMSKLKNSKYELKIIDKMEDGLSTGTLVELTLPIL